MGTDGEGGGEIGKMGERECEIEASGCGMSKSEE